VSIATGHTAEGVLLSAITGKIIAQHVRREPTDLPLEPFSPARFAT
jgi:glycine/D-amino acid oxidase-like deaminating enzyme